MEIENYSSSHKDWSCRAGLHPPSKADAVCAIPPRAPRLCVHQTSSCGGAEARRWRARFLQGPLDGAAPVAGRGRLVRHGRSGRWSTYLRTAIIRQSPRRRALHSIAEGFSPTARAHTGCIAQSPSARRLIRQSGFNAQSPSAPRQAPLSAIGYRLSAIGYRLSPIQNPRRLAAKRCAICTIMASHRERPAQRLIEPDTIGGRTGHSPSSAHALMEVEQKPCLPNF